MGINLSSYFASPLTDVDSLFTAASDDDFKKLKQLYEEGADVTLFNEDGFNLLHVAAEQGSEECVRLLLSFDKIDVNAKDTTETPIGDFGGTALHLAAAEGWPSIVYMMIDAGADVNAINVMGWTPMHYLIVNEEIKVRYYKKLTKR